MATVIVVLLICTDASVASSAIPVLDVLELNSYCSLNKRTSVGTNLSYAITHGFTELVVIQSPWLGHKEDEKTILGSKAKCDKMIAFILSCDYYKNPSVIRYIGLKWIITRLVWDKFAGGVEYEEWGFTVWGWSHIQLHKLSDAKWRSPGFLLNIFKNL